MYGIFFICFCSIIASLNSLVHLADFTTFFFLPRLVFRRGIFLIVADGFVAESINTSAKVTLDQGKITTVDLTVKAKVPGMSAEQFEAAAQNAKENCPISKSLNADITVNATLEA